MTGHQEPLDDLTFHDVPLHDFGNIGFRPHPVPYALGVNHDAGSILAMVQTTGLIGPYGLFQPKTFDFLFEKGLQPLRTAVRAAPARISLGPLVDAYED